jgi:MFS transporter, putative metabolite transport protein
VILDVLQAFVASIGVLLVLRFALGLAIGAEYAIGQTMLAEIVPSEGRGRRLSSLQASWYGGFLLAVVVAYALDGLGVDWRLILATGAIPALGTLLLRQGLPESPRWLISRGREDEAKAIVEEHLGSDYYEDEDLAEESEAPASFGRDTWRTTAFASIFFTCLVAPYFAIFTFAPEVFSSLGFVSSKFSIIVTNAIAFLGALTAWSRSSGSAAAGCC